MNFICRLNISNLLIYKHIRKVTNNSPDLYHVLSSWCTRGAHPIIHFYIYTLAYISSGNCVLSYSVLAANTQKHEYKMLKVLLLLSLAAFGSARLTTSGTNLLYNGQKVFLSGVNIAWNSYGYDFGNGQYASNSKSTLEGWLNSISGSGGNSVRKLIEIDFFKILFNWFTLFCKAFGCTLRVTIHRPTMAMDSSRVPTAPGRWSTIWRPSSTTLRLRI